ncbi:hypothetical protein GALL_338550 [mine drainage metagenome]|uniref:Uncharacterized protein n=1 Tax=mine drainage metagenome TaxID=410659 RepID=A0A1J5QLF3_9ZZZZ
MPNAKTHLLSGVAAALLAGAAMFAALPGHDARAETPAPDSGHLARLEAHIDRALDGGTLKTVDGAALLDSDVLLKIYVYAYGKRPVDYSAILTADTQAIDPPTPVQPTAAQKAAIDRLLQAARAHPKVLIRAHEIALFPYDAKAGGYVMQNRIFAKLAGKGYFFDNSPYHFVYVDFEPFSVWRTADPAKRQSIDTAIKDFEQFNLDIVGQVVASGGDSISIKPLAATLKDNVGGTVLTEGGGA